MQLERRDPTPGPEDGQLGFTVDEMANIAEKVLREIGLISGFSRLVLVIGHGSTSLNNPHESAYDCGPAAARGGPNARALAQMLNDRRIRERLADRGIDVPAETYFVGGLHNTCNESLAFFDLDLMPASHRAEFESVQRDCEDAVTATLTSVAAGSSRPRCRCPSPGRDSTSSDGRKTSRRCGPNAATPRTPSASSAGADARGCSSIAAPS